MSVQAPSAAATPLPTAGITRRMAAFAYEGVLLFGVVFVTGYLYATVTRQTHALQGQTGLQAFVFVVLAAYFVTFWSRGGQTVAMRAWHVRLVTIHDAPVSALRALVRYLLSWVWFAPALLAAHVAELRSAAEILSLLLVGVVAYATLALMHPQRQFLHDALCGTRMVTWRPQPPQAKSPA
jgi:uncharacterized RDD family membrane protein YckC